MFLCKKNSMSFTVSLYKVLNIPLKSTFVSRRDNRNCDGFLLQEVVRSLTKQRKICSSPTSAASKYPMQFQISPFCKMQAKPCGKCNLLHVYCNFICAFYPIVVCNKFFSLFQHFLYFVLQLRRCSLDRDFCMSGALVLRV